MMHPVTRGDPCGSRNILLKNEKNGKMKNGKTERDGIERERE